MTICCSKWHWSNQRKCIRLKQIYCCLIAWVPRIVCHRHCEKHERSQHGGYMYSQSRWNLNVPPKHTHVAENTKRQAATCLATSALTPLFPYLISKCNPINDGAWSRSKKRPKCRRITHTTTDRVGRWHDRDAQTRHCDRSTLSGGRHDLQRFHRQRRPSCSHVVARMCGSREHGHL